MFKVLLPRLQKSTRLPPRQQQLHTSGDAQAAFQLAEQANKTLGGPWLAMPMEATGLVQALTQRLDLAKWLSGTGAQSPHGENASGRNSVQG